MQFPHCFKQWWLIAIVVKTIFVRFETRKRSCVFSTMRVTIEWQQPRWTPLSAGSVSYCCQGIFSRSKTQHRQSPIWQSPWSAILLRYIGSTCNLTIPSISMWRFILLCWQGTRSCKVDEPPTSLQRPPLPFPKAAKIMSGTSGPNSGLHRKPVGTPQGTDEQAGYSPSISAQNGTSS